VVEKMLGHVLYEGIFEFVQRADFLGNAINGLPIVGPLRKQLMLAGRERLTLILGDQLIKFLGEYSASAAQNAAGFVLNVDNRPYFRAARRRLGKKLLETPISELLALNQLEMAILRDSMWTAIQEFRLPNEESLLDALYDDFGAEPFAILLPTQSQVDRGDAPFFEAGRDVLHGTLTQFLASADWRAWTEREVLMQPPHADAHDAHAEPPPPANGASGAVAANGASAPAVHADGASSNNASREGASASTATADDAFTPPTSSPISSWDGWD